MIDRGYRVNNGGTYGLSIAISNGNLELVEYLVSLGADVQFCLYYRYALKLAVKSKNIELVRYLKRNFQIDVNRKEFGCQSALEAAAKDQEMLALLSSNIVTDI
jgi:ankyrin repeat protein